MTRAARRLFGAGLILAAVMVTFAGALTVVEQTEGCNVLTCEVSK